MGVKKLSSKEAEKFFETARGHLTRAKDDPNDTMSQNVMFGIHNHFSSLAAASSELINGVNDVLERLERIEARLNKPAGR